ncbi:hypothetical protein HK104_000692 [Borealophlyctis nickersoniae]|nr:hypothetical protein HK104_000692 [Borealophlyctis nickersoniae]
MSSKPTTTSYDNIDTTINNAATFASTPASVGIDESVPGRLDAAPVPNDSALANAYSDVAYPGVVQPPNRFHGGVMKGVGKVEEALGKATKDTALTAAGLADQANGQAELDYAKVKHDMRAEARREEKEARKADKAARKAEGKERE